MVGKARDWIAAHRAEIALSLRITVPRLIAFALGELLGVKQVYWAVLTPNYRVAPVTAIIVLLGPHGDGSPVQAAIERLIKIALGCAVALGVALAITPSRAHRLLSAAAADALIPIHEQIERLLAGAPSPSTEPWCSRCMTASAARSSAVPRRPVNAPAISPMRPTRTRSCAAYGASATI